MQSTRQLFERMRSSPNLENYRKFKPALENKLKLCNLDRNLFLYNLDSFSENDFLNLVYQGIELYLKRPIEIITSLRDSENFLNFRGKPIYSIYEKDKIILRNPAVNKIQSWYNLRYVETNKHVGNNPLASRFHKGIRKEVEREAFNKGKGYFDIRTSKQAFGHRIFLLHEFDEPVGVSYEGETCCVKLQVDRTRVHRGYVSKIHGYPIPRKDLQIELKRNGF